MDDTNRSGLEIFVLQGRKVASAHLASINVVLGFETDLDGRRGSIVGVLQQLAKDCALKLGLSASRANTEEGGVDVPVNSPKYLANILSISARWFTSTNSSCPEPH